MRRAWLIALAGGTLVLAGCDDVRQSALRPTGADALAIRELALVMTVGGTVILLGVMALAIWAFVGPRHRWRLPGRGLLIGGGVVFPTVTLAALLFYEIGVFALINRALGDDALRIEVIGYQYWWEVRYRDPAGGIDFVTANEVVLPAQTRAEVELVAADVIHSFWIPSLTGKMDLIPGRRNALALTTGDPAVLRGQCAEYCGAQHALMAFDVEVLTPAEFEAWRTQQRRPAAEPFVELLAQGRRAFLENGCGACHAVRGTPADGRIGPDLTHVGGRRSIAAGAFPQNVGTLAGWIADAQHLKPGNGMPSFETLDGWTIRAIASWLASLE